MFRAVQVDGPAGLAQLQVQELDHHREAHREVDVALGHLVLEAGGESAAAALVAKLGSQAETARELCYRLYTLCERKKRAADALAYNGLVQSWPEITRLAGALATETPRAATPSTSDLFDPSV